MKSQVEKSNNICNRKCYIDLLKVIAIIMVLYNHSGAYWWGPLTEDIVSGWKNTPVIRPDSP